jgi:hypothetical protein
MTDQATAFKNELLAEHGLVEDGDLVLFRKHGVAVQRDMSVTAAYDQAYFDKCAGYQGSAIAAAVNAGRARMVEHSYGCGPLLDIGVGSGAFLLERKRTFGYDVNPVAEAWLKARGRWIEPDAFAHFAAFSFWDVIEHLPDPDVYFHAIAPGAFVFASLPIFADLMRIRES